MATLEILRVTEAGGVEAADACVEDLQRLLDGAHEPGLYVVPAPAALEGGDAPPNETARRLFGADIAGEVWVARLDVTGALVNVNVDAQRFAAHAEAHTGEHLHVVLPLPPSEEQTEAEDGAADGAMSDADEHDGWRVSDAAANRRIGDYFMRQPQAKAAVCANCDLLVHAEAARWMHLGVDRARWCVPCIERCQALVSIDWFALKWYFLIFAVDGDGNKMYHDTVPGVDEWARGRLDVQVALCIGLHQSHDRDVAALWVSEKIACEGDPSKCELRLACGRCVHGLYFQPAASLTRAFLSGLPWNTVIRATPSPEFLALKLAQRLARAAEDLTLWRNTARCNGVQAPDAAVTRGLHNLALQFADTGGLDGVVEMAE